jgi:hypothetical protein
MVQSQVRSCQRAVGMRLPLMQNLVRLVQAWGKVWRLGLSSSLQQIQLSLAMMMDIVTAHGAQMMQMGCGVVEATLLC